MARASLTARLAEHVATAAARTLPEDVVYHARLHLLDTLAAMVSGARMAPGRLALAYARREGGRREATVAASRLRVGAVAAALANGIAAHADETDDSHPASITHPGCAVVPAALAMAERAGASGRALLNAVALGYDVTARTGIALGGETYWRAGRDSHSFAGTIGAAAAAGALAGLDARRCAFVLSYGAQQASGTATLFRDGEHVEKAFVFGGMPARSGVAAATMVQAGMTGVADAFDGEPSFFTAYAVAGEPARAFRGLGARWEVTRTNIKRWSVGSPVQAALDSIEALMREHGIGAREVAAVRIHLPTRGARVVDSRSMPDINAQHLAALMLVDGTVTFAASHDLARMRDPAVAALRTRVSLVPSPLLDRARPTRQAIVEIDTADGRRLRHRTRAVRGTVDNPMTEDELAAKARDLMAPVLGGETAQAVIDAVAALERAPDVRALAALLGAG